MPAPLDSPQGGPPGAADWRAWWNAPQRLFANERHLRIHYAQLADGIIAALPAARPLVVLDYGCGQALDAARVAGAAGLLLLYDTAPVVRAALAERHRAAANVAVLDERGLAGVAAGSVDMIVVSSVIQYMTRAEFTALLQRWCGWLKPGGRLLLADVIPPEAGMAQDVAALLALAWRNGFLGAALAGLARTTFSGYRRLRRDRGLSVYDEADILALLERAGFAGRRHPANLHPNQARMTIVGTRRPAAAARGP